MFVGTTPERMRRLTQGGSGAGLRAPCWPPPHPRWSNASTTPPRGPRCSGLGRRPRPHAPVVGTRVGAGRRRRLLQGPDHDPRHDRRAARRRAAGRPDPRRCWVAPTRRSPWRRTNRPASGSRSACSTRPRRWRATTGTACAPASCCAAVSSAMSDEVDHLQSLPDRRPRAPVSPLSSRLTTSNGLVSVDSRKGRSAVTITLRLLGGFDVAVDGVPVAPEQWTRRQAASLVKVLALAPGPPAAPRAGDRGALAGRERRRRGTTTAQGGPLRAACARWRRLGGAAAQRHGRAAARGRRQHRRRRVPGRGRGEALEAGTPRRPRGSSSRTYGGRLLPEDVYESLGRRGARVGPLGPRRPAAPGRALGRRAERGPDRRGGPPRADPRARWTGATYARRCGSSSGSTTRCCRELGTTAEPRGRAAAGPAARAGRPSRAARPGEARACGWSAAAASATRSATRWPAPTRGGARRCCSPGLPGVGKTAVLGLAEALARQRDWRTGRGTASAVEGPWPYAPVLEAFGELCRKHPALLDGLDDRFRIEIEKALSGRDVTLDRRVQPPAAVRRGRRADAAGRDRPRAAAHRRRPPGRRRGVAAAAALPLPLRRDRARRDRGGTPAAGLRDRPAGRRQSRTPRRRLAHRAGATRRRRPRDACSPTASRTCPPRRSRRSASSAGALPFSALELASRPGDRGRAALCPAGAPETFQRAGPARHRSSPPTSCSPSPTSTRTPTYEQLEAALSSRHRRARRGRLPVPARARARAPGRDDPAEPAGRWSGARSPNGSARSGGRPPGWRTCSSRRGSARGPCPTRCAPSRRQVPWAPTATPWP